MLRLAARIKLDALATADTLRRDVAARELRETLSGLGITGPRRWRTAWQYHRNRRCTPVLNRQLMRASPETIMRHVRDRVVVEPGQHWRDALLHPGPLLVVTPHYGPFTLGLLRLCADLAGHREVHAFYDPPEKNPGTANVGAIMARCCDNFRPVFNDRRGVVRALKVLRAGGVMTIMPDVYQVNGQCLAVPFLSHLSYAMTGTAFLALKSSALLLHVYVQPVAGGVCIRADKPYAMPVSGNDEDDIYRQTCRTFESLERQLLRDPSYWDYLPQLKARLGMPLASLSGDAQLRQMIDTLSCHLDIDIANPEGGNSTDEAP